MNLRQLQDAFKSQTPVSFCKKDSWLLQKVVVELYPNGKLLRLTVQAEDFFQRSRKLAVTPANLEDFEIAENLENEMTDKLTVQEALKLVEDSHIQYVTRLQEARLLLNFADNHITNKILKEEIASFLEKTK